MATASASQHLLHHTMSGPAHSDRNQTQRSAQHIWLITGPAGCGKSTVASYVADHLSLPFIEGDEFHPPANIEKMSSGIPLTDADRWDWLIALREESIAELARGRPGVVVTCSALKRKYRDVMRIASYNDPLIHVHFVYLHATEELLLARVKARQGHYMKDDMVKSQFRSLEEPYPDETDCLVVGVGGTMPEVQELALRTVSHALSSAVSGEIHAAPS